METRMSSNLKTLPIVAAFLVMAVFAALLAISAFQSQTTRFDPFSPRPVPTVNFADIELYYLMRTVLSTVNIALLVVLVTTYFSIYLKTRSEFTIGLLIFATVFLIKDIASSPFIYRAFRFDLFGLGPFAFIPDLLELAALSVLLYLSVKY